MNTRRPVFALAIATVFGIGYVPFASGTFGAAAGLVLWWLLPGTAAMAKNPRDCETAQSVFSKALSDYPDNAFISYQLGVALNCLARANPAKVEDYGPRAISVRTIPAPS